MFDQFKKLEVRPDATCWMDLPEVTPDARLLLKPAIESNHEYYNEFLKKTGKKSRRSLAKATVASLDVKQARDDDRALFPNRVIVGWEGMQDSDNDNADIPFTPELCIEFCQKLPSWIFDRLRLYAALPENFLDEGQESAPEPIELAKN